MAETAFFFTGGGGGESTPKLVFRSLLVSVFYLIAAMTAIGGEIAAISSYSGSRIDFLTFACKCYSVG